MPFAVFHKLLHIAIYCNIFRGKNVLAVLAAWDVGVKRSHCSVVLPNRGSRRGLGRRRLCQLGQLCHARVIALTNKKHKQIGEIWRKQDKTSAKRVERERTWENQQTELTASISPLTVLIADVATFSVHFKSNLILKFNKPHFRQETLYIRELSYVSTRELSYVSTSSYTHCIGTKWPNATFCRAISRVLGFVGPSMHRALHQSWIDTGWLKEK